MPQVMNANLDPTLANRYLADQLTEQERDDYETFLVSSPEAVRELEATARLKVGLEKLRKTGELDHLLKQRPSSLHTWLMPLAATLAVVAIAVPQLWSTLVHIGSTLVHVESTPVHIESTPVRIAAAPLLFPSHVSLAAQAGHSLPIAVTAAFYSKRTAMSAEHIEKPASPAAVVLRVLPAPLNRSHPYRLSLSRLRDSGFELVGQIDHLTPKEDGFVESYADADRLTPGQYQVVVTDETTPPDTDAGVFMFDLIAKKR